MHYYRCLRIIIQLYVKKHSLLLLKLVIDILIQWVYYDDSLSNSDLTPEATDEYQKRLYGYLASRAAGLLGNINNNQPYSVDILFIALTDANTPPL